MLKNVAGQSINLLVIDTVNNVPKTGDAANLTAYLSADYGAATALDDTSATEVDATNMPGLYSFGLTQAETNYHAIEFSGKSSTSGVYVVPKCVYTVAENVPANITQVGGTNIPSANVNGVLPVDVFYVDGEAATPTLLDGMFSGTLANADTTAIDLGTLTYADDELNDLLIEVYDDSADEYHSRWISDYAGATSIATLDEALPFTTESGIDTYVVYHHRRNFGASIRTAIGMASANFDTQISTIDDFLDTEIAAIKAKTDLIPASPAAVGSSMTLTAAERNSIADALLDRTDGVETGITPRAFMRYVGATATGKLSGAGTNTEIFVGMDGSTTRLTCTVDSSGNRTAITYG